MANILGIFTAVILAVAAFVAVKNNARFEAEIANKTVEQASLATSQKRLETAQALSARLPTDLAGVEETIAAKTEEGVTLKEGNDALQTAIEEKTALIAGKKAKLDANKEKLEGAGNLKGLAADMKAKGVETRELEMKIASSQAELANLTSANTAAQADATRRRDDLETMTKGGSLPSLKTRIRNIYPTWGFVTLTDGNNAGVITNSTLDVVRNGEVIAKLLVTAVERGSASASIIPDSMGQDITLMVGDRVVAGSKRD